HLSVAFTWGHGPPSCTTTSGAGLIAPDCNRSRVGPRRSSLGSPGETPTDSPFRFALPAGTAFSRARERATVEGAGSGRASPTLDPSLNRPCTWPPPTAHRDAPKWEV